MFHPTKQPFRHARTGIALLLIKTCLSLFVVQIGHAERLSFRKTSDRWLDLTETLSAERRWQEAIEICHWNLSKSAATTDDHAKWTIRLSQVIHEQSIDAEAEEPGSAVDPIQPIMDLLKSYPDHSRSVFLRAGAYSINQSNLRSRSANAALAVDAGEVSTSLVGDITRLTRQLNDLTETVRDELNLAASSRSTSSKNEIAELRRLEQELSLSLISLALFQSEIFPADSVDAISAATKAGLLATKSIQTLPSGSKARVEAQRLLADSKLRMGDLKEASKEIENIRSQEDVTASPSLVALITRYHLSSSDIRSAQKTLIEFYGQNPIPKKDTLPVDLARLEWLLAAGRNAEAASWIEQMGDQVGSYARRRGEAIVLSSIKKEGAENATFAATRGRDQIRKGNYTEAASLLSLAARNATDPITALNNAKLAAAALKANNATIAAAELLSEIALQNAEASEASSIHLQALVLLSDQSADSVPGMIEQSLRTHLTTWPNRSTRGPATQWLITLLQGQNRLTEAALVATKQTVNQNDRSTTSRAIGLWHQAYLNRSQSADGSTIEKSLNEFFASPGKDGAGDELYRQIGSMILPVTQLRSLPAESSDSNDPPGDSRSANDWTIRLILFRLGRIQRFDPSSMPSSYHPALRERLIEDGSRDPNRRLSIAKVLGKMDTNASSPLEAIRQAVWLGKTPDAIESVIAQSLRSDDPALLEAVAELLVQQAQNQVIEMGIAVWDRLASGSKTASFAWHRYKIAAIEALRKIGNNEQARQRAAYILLVTPSIDDAFRSQYEHVVDSVNRND